MNGKHVCLVTPGHLSTNPRLVKEADALVAAGFRVTVIASRFVAWADLADAEFAGRAWKVHEVAFGRMAGWRIHLLQKLRQRLAALVYRLTGHAAEQAFHPVVPALTRTACAIQADLYIAHNLAALPAAAMSASKHGARLGFDAEDFHRGEYASDAPESLPLRLTRVLEERYIPLCEHLTAASPGIAQAYANVCGVKPPCVILNVFSRYSSPQTRPRIPDPSRPTLYWFSQTLGPNRGLETLVKAVSLSSTRPHVYLRGQSSPGYLAELRQLAILQGVSHLLHFLPPASPGQMVELASSFDIGVASEPGHSANNELALSNKLFTFILAGLPVLASATAAQAQIAESMAGTVFLYEKENAEGLALQIDRLFGSTANLLEARQCAWQLGQDHFNWEIESRRLIEAVDNCFQRPARRPMTGQMT